MSYAHELSESISRTAPSTPVNLGHEPFVYDTLGGGDNASGISQLGYTSGTLRVSSRRSAHSLASPRFRNGGPLGSPILLRSPAKRESRVRPLTRAAQAPIPLWEYPTPPRTSTVRSFPGDSPLGPRFGHATSESITLEDLGLTIRTSSTPATAIDVASSSSNMACITSPGSTFSGAVALAIVASVSETIHRECFSMLFCISTVAGHSLSLNNLTDDSFVSQSRCLSKKCLTAFSTISSTQTFPATGPRGYRGLLGKRAGLRSLQPSAMVGASFRPFYCISHS